MDAKLLRELASAIASSMQGQRRHPSGPRSRVVEAIAVLLYSRPMRAAEIAETLGFTTRYVSSYLSYWKSRGLFEYRDGYWMLTEEGRRYAERVIEKYTRDADDQMVLLARKILATQPTAARNGNIAYHQPGQYHGFLPNLATSQDIILTAETGKEARKHCANALISTYSALDDDEKEVLQALLEHYTEWGKTYLYLDQLQDKLEADTLWLRNVLRKLQSKNIVYVYHDKRMGIRVGLSKQARQLLDNCLSRITRAATP